MTVASLAVIGGRRDAGAQTGGVSPVFGTNMGLSGPSDQLIYDTKTQSVLRSAGMPVIRMPFRAGDTPQNWVAGLQAIKSIGATPLLIVSGPHDVNSAAHDVAQLALAEQVFPRQTVYVEFGNEDDCGFCGGGPYVSPQAYTAAWNASIPTLRRLHSTFRFVGPVTFQAGTGGCPAAQPCGWQYIQYFVSHVAPSAPVDVISWHEYTCSATSDFNTACMAGIAHWAAHADQINQVEQQAIGHTIPFMITEWNMDPNDEPRYLNAVQAGQWTNAAIQMLLSLRSKGLIGAMQYLAAGHGGGSGFQLIDSGANPTPQGRAFFAAMQAGGGQAGPPPPAPKPGPVPPPARPRPSGPPAPAPVSGGGGGAGQDVGGWRVAWGARVVQLKVSSGVPVMSISPSNFSAVSTTRIVGVKAGIAVTIHVRVISGVAAQLSPFVMDGSYAVHFGSRTMVPVGAEKAITMVVGSTPLRSIGVQAGPVSARTAVAIESVSW